jgi:hypothetical protein
MIRSNVLCKEYKTIAGYKIAIGRYKKQVVSNLNHLRDCYKTGWNLYLGDPIYPQIRDLKIELKNIDHETKSILENENKN